MISCSTRGKRGKCDPGSNQPGLLILSSVARQERQATDKAGKIAATLETRSPTEILALENCDLYPLDETNKPA